MKSSVLRIGKRALRYLKRLKTKRVAKTIYKVELLQCLKRPRDLQTFLSDFRSRKEPLFFFGERDIEFFKKGTILSPV